MFTAPSSDATVARIYDYGLQFGESRGEIRDALGTPTRIEVRVQENRHVEGATDSLFTLAYPGLTFELNRPGPVEGELLTSVRLLDGGRELPGGLRVGHMTRGELLERLGDPARTRSRGDTTVLVYDITGPAADRSVDLLVAGDTLRAVAWAPYVD